jgi:hypothetical protein
MSLSELFNSQESPFPAVRYLGAPDLMLQQSASANTILAG